MNTRKASRKRWDAVRSELSLAGGATARIPKHTIPHPRDAGARPTSTFPEGQLADYALDATDGPPLVVREFADNFEVALDGVAMTAKVVQSVEQHPGAMMYVGAALLGGAVGSSISTKREGALVGIGLGLLFAAALDSTLDDPSRRG